MQQALGLIETVGLAAAYEAADTAVKTACVELIGYELSKGDGMVTVKIAGNVGAVQAGIKAAQLSASLVSKVFSVQVIPRPSRSLDAMVFTKETVLYTDEPDEPAQVEQTEEQLPLLEVAEEEAEDQPAESESEDQPAAGGELSLESGADDPQVVEETQEIVQAQVETKMVGETDLSESIITCNICKDPACNRKKGDPKRTCLHYFKS